MAVYRFKPTTFTQNPFPTDSGTSVASSGIDLLNTADLANFAGESDGLPGVFPSGFPAQLDQPAYEAAICYGDMTSTPDGRTNTMRATNLVEIGTDIAIATKLAGMTINSAWMRIGLMDGDLYAGFPTGGGGLLHTYGVRVELRNGSGALASSYRQFANVFSDGGSPEIINLNVTPWTFTEASLSTAFGLNFYVYNSDGADVFELTPNFGIFALELSVDATAAASGPSVDRIPTCSGLAKRYRRFTRS
jgi:hypothetical protein